MPRALRNGRAWAVTTIPVRCVIYCRKSTAAGLDREFTSLDNQRERGEAYIASQGWTLEPTRYDDGGFSGGTIERPAFRRLLADVEAGRIDAIVCYRLDRISRSLVDFVNVHEFFEKHNVALVSVTESINTSTPHGRMMVNVLLSFAQYERELIGERTRDKIQAARRRGKWTGGMPPLGYDAAPEGGRLEVNQDEAAQVQTIFEMYAESPSLVKVAEELSRRGWRRKSWTTKEGKRREGGPWDRKTLRDLLLNPLYAGMQKLGDDTFKGEHEAIVPERLFKQVQGLMAENRSNGEASAGNRYGALLRGILRCAACDTAMTYAVTKKDGKAYRYYRCQAAQRRGHDSCPTKSIQADKVEAFVVDRIRCIGADPDLQAETFRQAVAQVMAERRGLKAEAKRLDRELAKSKKNIENLVRTLTETNGAARDAVRTELEKAQEQVRTLENRMAEIQEKRTSLEAQQIDEADLARTLEVFDPIWDVLLTPEKERVLRLLINCVRYNGETQRLDIDFRLAGITELAQEVGGDA